MPEAAKKGKDKKVIDFVEDFADVMKAQLVEDEKRWGDTWKKVPIEGQEVRIAQRLQRYFDDFNTYRLSIPWAKVANYALIAWTKEQNPELIAKPAVKAEGE